MGILNAFSILAGRMTIVGGVEEGASLVLLDGQNETNDKTVQSQSLSENEDENHTSEEEGLLSVGADTSVTDNTNGHTGSQTSQTDGETRREMSETLEGRVLSKTDCTTKKSRSAHGHRGQQATNSEFRQNLHTGAHTDTRGRERGYVRTLGGDQDSNDKTVDTCEGRIASETGRSRKEATANRS